mgnify:CR=1 FL=1
MEVNNLTKTFTIENYLADDSPFKIGIRLDEQNERGILAIGVNGKDVYKIQPDLQVAEHQSYALSCRPLMYLDWLYANLEHLMVPDHDIERPGIDYIKNLKQEDVRKYIRVTGKHLMLPDMLHHQPLFFLKDDDSIEISWDSSEQGLFFYERGIEIVPAGLFEQKVNEVLKSHGYDSKL